MIELYDDWIHGVAPAGARLVYGGGPLLNSVKLFGVFVNDPGGTDFPFASQMSSFLDWISTSDILAGLVEYNVSGQGSHIGDASLSLSGSTPPPPPGGDCSAELQALLQCLGYASINNSRGSLGLPHRNASSQTTIQDSDIQSLLASGIAAGNLPKPDADTLFVSFFPSSVTIQFGSDASCQTFCGYHNTFALSDGTPVYYAVLPFPTCSGCLGGGMTTLDALTSITTHEIAEGITDPAADGSGWYDQTNGEIGDICAWQERQDGQYEVQLLWSNRENQCI